MGNYKELFPNFDGNMVLSGFDTPRDAKLAKRALERLCGIMAGQSLSSINEFLEPYRRKAAQEIDKQKEKRDE